MCLSRLLDDVVETNEYGKCAFVKMVKTQIRQCEDELSSFEKKVVHLRGVVPFEISRWKKGSNSAECFIFDKDRL